MLYPVQVINLALDAEKKKSEALLTMEQERNQALSKQIAALELAAKQRELEVAKQNAETNSRFEGLLEKALGRVTDLEEKVKEKEHDVAKPKPSKTPNTHCPDSPDVDESSDSDDGEAGITTPSGKTAPWTQYRYIYIIIYIIIIYR